MPISLRRSQTEICMVITMPKLIETIRTTRMMVVRARLSFVKEARRVTGEGGISPFVSNGGALRIEYLLELFPRPYLHFLDSR